MAEGSMQSSRPVPLQPALDREDRHMTPDPPTTSSQLVDGLSVRGAVAHQITHLRQHEHRMAMRRAQRGLQLPRSSYGPDATGAIWAVTMVKNEADILTQTVGHLLAQGVDRVLVADNGSSDETVDLLLGLRDKRVLLARDTEPAYYQQAKMTLLGRYAARRGAGWIIPFDADELWFGQSASLADSLRATSAKVARADIHNAFPVSGEPGSFRIERAPHSLRKVAYRASRLALLDTGNHWVSRPGRIDTTFRIVHVPWRSREQLGRKLRQGRAAFSGIDVDDNVGAHWRRFGGMSDDGLNTVWSEIIHGRPVDGLSWSPEPGAALYGNPFSWSRWPEELRSHA